MTGFDAELYLRLLGERMLIDGSERNRGPWRPPIAEAAAALVAVHAAKAEEVERVLEDYALARALRDDPSFVRRVMIGAFRPPPREEHKPFGPRRVVPCARTLELPSGDLEVRYASLSEAETSVAVTIALDRTAPWMGGPQSITLTDDRGASEVAHFSGAGSNDSMIGRLTAAQALAPDTAWIALDGVRLELEEWAHPSQTELEPLPEEEPALRYLWRRLSDAGDRFEPDLEPAVEALLAAGAFSREDPVLADIRAVRDALSGAATTAPPPQAPQPWRSLLARRGRAGGPVGSVVLDAVTPAFDDTSVAVLEVTSEPDGFQAEVETIPGGLGPMPFQWGPEGPQLAWWARDDRDNHYLGHRGQWSSGDDVGHGIIEFEPALDPRASRLDLMPTAETTRAVISFALPWGRQP